MNKIIQVRCLGLVAILIAAAPKVDAQGNLFPQQGKQSVTLINTLPPNTAPCPPPSIEGNMEVCSGGVDTLTVVGTAGSTYVWAPGGATSSSIAVTISGTTTYTVTQTNGCGSTNATITINLGNAPVATANTNNGTICSGDTVKLTAGGGGRYVWSTGATTQIIKEVPTVNTTYTLYVYADSTTCMDSSEVSVIVNQSITSSVIASSDTVCLGNSATLFVTSSSGNPSYIWSNGATTSSIAITPDSTTTYYVLIAGECANDSIAKVITVVNPMVTITSVDTVCKGSTVTFTASGANTYLWSNGSTLNPANIVINTDSTLVSVAGTVGGCTVRAHKTLYVYFLMNQIINDTVCKGATTIGVSVTGGKSPYTYTWNNGITSDSPGPFTVTPPPKVYICAVTDGCGNTAIYDINLIIRAGSHPAFLPIPDTINAGGFINFENFSRGAVSYTWNFGDGTTAADSAPYHEFNAAGAYSVCMVATNSFGCTDTLCEDVLAITEPIVVPNVFTPNGDGVNDVFHVTINNMQYYEMQIFNRWGQQVFQANSPNVDWTGRSSSGVMEVTGIYYYIIQAVDYSGNQHNLKGYVQLIR